MSNATIMREQWLEWAAEECRLQSYYKETQDRRGYSQGEHRYLRRILANYQAPRRMANANSLCRWLVALALMLQCVSALSGSAVKRIEKPSMPDNTVRVFSLVRPSMYCIDEGLAQKTKLHSYRCPVSEEMRKSRGRYR